MNVRMALVGAVVMLGAATVAAPEARGALAADLKAMNFDPNSSIWNDSSGNGNYAYTPNGVTAPTLVGGQTPNGSAVVRFTGTQWMHFINPISSSAYTALVFVRPGDASNNPKTIVAGDSGSFQYRIGGDTVGGNPAGDRQEVLRRGLANLGKGSTVMSTDSFYNINVAVDANAGSFRLNGAADGTSSGSGGFSVPVYLVGAAGNTTGEFFVGDIAEIRLYDTVLNATTPNAAGDPSIQSIELAYNTAYVPEPASIAMLGMAGLGMLARRRRIA